MKDIKYCKKCGKMAVKIYEQSMADEMIFGVGDKYLCEQCLEDLLISDEMNREEPPYCAEDFLEEDADGDSK